LLLFQVPPPVHRWTSRHGGERTRGRPGASPDRLVGVVWPSPPSSCSFAELPANLRGDQLGAWITTAQQAALAGIPGFAAGLTSDLEAVTAGLTPPHSSARSKATSTGSNDQATEVRPRRL
jgi:hypothetical protein